MVNSWRKKQINDSKRKLNGKAVKDGFKMIQWCKKLFIILEPKKKNMDKWEGKRTDQWP